MTDRSIFSTDRPLTHPEEDKLGYARFAKNLASSIINMTPHQGIVISLHGAWGSGKTTVINFMLHYINELSDEDSIMTLRFNPWWFSSRENLTRLLIEQLMILLGRRDFANLKKNLADLIDIVSGIDVVPGSSVGKVLAKRLRKSQDLASLKDSIDKVLLDKNQKILVVIDDIDRLSPNEITDLFRTIKAVANFSNIIYFLAFDNEVVVQSLEEHFVPSGKSYLEKIVQVPFELPLPDRSSLRLLLFSKLDEILIDTPQEDFDQHYWANVFFDGIDPFIQTPREIVRLINALRATYPSVKGEVNPVDFVAIETVRIFIPDLYQMIRTNEDILVGVSPHAWRDDVQKQHKEIFSRWLDDLPHDLKEPAGRLLSRLFPRFAQAFGGASYHSDYLPIWRKELRICTPELFPIYFRFAVSPDILSAVEMKLLIEKTSNPDQFSNALLELAQIRRQDGTTKARAALERLQDFTRDDIPEENIGHVICAFFEIGDQLLIPEDEKGGLFGFGNDLRIDRIIRQLLQRIPRENRYQYLMNAIDVGSSIGIMESEIAILGQEHGKYGSSKPWDEESRTVDADQLKELENRVLEKIRTSAFDGTLLENPCLVSILYRWKAWSDNPEEIENWMADVIKDDDGCAEFISKFGQTQSSHSIGDRVSRSRYRLDPEWIKPFYEPAMLIQRCRDLLASGSLPDELKNAVQQFVIEYDARERGEDPENG